MAWYRSSKHTTVDPHSLQVDQLRSFSQETYYVEVKMLAFSCLVVGGFRILQVPFRRPALTSIAALASNSFSMPPTTAGCFIRGHCYCTVNEDRAYLPCREQPPVKTNDECGSKSWGSGGTGGQECVSTPKRHKFSAPRPEPLPPTYSSRLAPPTLVHALSLPTTLRACACFLP